MQLAGSIPTPFALITDDAGANGLLAGAYPAVAGSTSTLMCFINGWSLCSL